MAYVDYDSVESPVIIETDNGSVNNNIGVVVGSYHVICERTHGLDKGMEQCTSPCA